jgi:hypothetical protein
MRPEALLLLKGSQGLPFLIRCKCSAILTEQNFCKIILVKNRLTKRTILYLIGTSKVTLQDDRILANLSEIDGRRTTTEKNRQSLAKSSLGSNYGWKRSCRAARSAGDYTGCRFYVQKDTHQPA